jgi:hypothetical protein
MLIHARERVEHRAFSHVGVARKRDDPIGFSAAFDPQPCV